MLDMQEVTGSSPVSPTNHPFHAQSDRASHARGAPATAALARCVDGRDEPDDMQHAPENDASVAKVGQLLEEYR